jgi:SAM-dependent methyltransferase
VTTERLHQARERLRPYVEQGRSADGWSFNVHSQELEQRAWDYDLRATGLIAAAERVLDIGTGGGERFSRYCAAHRGRAIATEGWPTNAPIAAVTLRPQRIDVILCDDEWLPLANESFDLVLNRHSGFQPGDVSRVLKPGATFYTEQVWDHWRELKRFLPRMIEYRDLYHRYEAGLWEAGMEIMESRTHVIPAAYKNLGEFVFMLCVTESWTIPNFDPLGDDLEALLQLEQELTTRDGLVLSDGAFVIEAKKARAASLT